MNEPLNHKPDLGTLARHALYRELLVDMSEDEAEALVGRLEIRVRGPESPERRPSKIR